MVLKRKRSDSEISGASSLSSPSFCESVDRGTNVFHPGPHMQSLLSSRTRKRHRDNRPSPETVHQNTLNLLFNAQKVGPMSPLPSQDATPATSSARSLAQPSLHAFWNLPTRATSCGSSIASDSPPPTTRQTLGHLSNCEDCNAPFESPDAEAMDVDMMDFDVSAVGADYGCSVCGKQVCHQCSVSNLGYQRRCLICAGKKRWIGGLGWMDS